MGRWLVYAAVGLFIAVSAYNYGHHKGQTDAPEFARLEELRVAAEPRVEIERLQTLMRNALSPEECLPIVIDASLDLNAFCRDYLADAEQESYDDRSSQEYLKRRTRSLMPAPDLV